MTTPTGSPQPGTLVAGKYRLGRLLGQGGMGSVHLAEHVDLGREVAIKVLLPEFAERPEVIARFRQEARAAAAIGHPGICEVMDLGIDPAVGAYIVMERLDGESLRDRLQREGTLSVADACHILATVLETLAVAHEKGVVHRDLKPDNLFLVARPVPAIKILDFGISKVSGRDDVTLTRTGVVMGTPLYMSPEQARGTKDVGPATDLYALGAVLFEALSGQPPFPGESYNAVLAQVLTEVARPVEALRRDVPPPLTQLIAELLEKDPTRRPQPARAVAARLRSVGQAMPTALDQTRITQERPVAAHVTAPPHAPQSAPAAASPRSLPPPPVSERKGPPVALVAGAVIGLVALGGAGLWLMARKEPPAKLDVPAIATRPDAPLAEPKPVPPEPEQPAKPSEPAKPNGPDAVAANAVEVGTPKPLSPCAPGACQLHAATAHRLLSAPLDAPERLAFRCTLAGEGLAEQGVEALAEGSDGRLLALSGDALLEVDPASCATKVVTRLPQDGWVHLRQLGTGGWLVQDARAQLHTVDLASGKLSPYDAPPTSDLRSVHLGPKRKLTFDARGVVRDEQGTVAETSERLLAMAAPLVR